MTDQAPEQKSRPPRPEELAWANKVLEREAESAGVSRGRAWSALRDRVLTVNGATLALSLIALQISEDLSSKWAIKSSWGALLAGLGLGLISLLLDYRQATNRSRWSELEEKTRMHVHQTKAEIDDAKTKLDWLRKRASAQEWWTDFTLYLSLMAYVVGISLLVAFAWINL